MSYPVPGGSHRRPRAAGWWDPLAEIEAIHRRLDQLFFGPNPAQWDTGWAWADLDETTDAWVVRAPLPGVRPEAVDVDLDERRLSVRGATGAEEPGAPAVGRSRPREFAYRIMLPGEVDADRAWAVLENGVLTVTLPRSARAASHKIPVGTGGTDELGAASPGLQDITASGSWDERHHDDEEPDDPEPTTAPPAPVVDTRMSAYHQPSGVTYLSAEAQSRFALRAQEHPMTDEPTGGPAYGADQRAPSGEPDDLPFNVRPSEHEQESHDNG